MSSQLATVSASQKVSSALCDCTDLILLTRVSLTCTTLLGSARAALARTLCAFSLGPHRLATQNGHFTLIEYCFDPSSLSTQQTSLALRASSHGSSRHAGSSLIPFTLCGTLSITDHGSLSPLSYQLPDNYLTTTHAHSS